MPFRQEPVREMRSEEPSAASDDRNLLRTRGHVSVLLIRHVKLGERFSTQFPITPSLPFLMTPSDPEPVIDVGVTLC